MMKKLRKIMLYILSLLIIAILVGVYIAINDIVPNKSIRPIRVYSVSSLTNFLHYDKFDIKTWDGIKLKGLFIHAKCDTPLGTIILLHGINSNKESQIYTAKILSENGFNAIAFDLRAHGKSGGDNCTFGYYEKYDVSSYINEALKKYPNIGPIGIMGYSLGGAIAIQAMARDKRIKCGIVTSTFARLKETGFDYMRRLVHIPFRFVSDISLENSGRIAHFSADKINPEEYAKKITQPVLLFHGSKDEWIPVNYGRRVFFNLKSAHKEFYVIRGANHSDVYEVGGKMYLYKIVSFFLQNMGQKD